MTGLQGITRVVHKEHYDQQHFFNLPYSTLPPLPDDAVYIRPRLLGLGSNNLSYCAQGGPLHWWEAFPVPADLPEPYNDTEQYGIAPGWGYGEVLKSTIAELKEGTVMFGFMPLSAFPFQLQLEKSKGLASHWFDVKESRNGLMPLYRRYQAAEDALLPDNKMHSSFSANSAVWGSGYCLNRFVLKARDEDPVISPFPEFKAPWPEEAADLRDTLVVCLAAGTKTNRAFVHQLVTNRAPDRGPAALLEVSGSTDSIVPELKPSFEHWILTYQNATNDETLSWITNLGVHHIVICDFGGRNGFIETFTTALRVALHESSNQNLESVRIDIIGIGGEPKVYTPEEKVARQARNKKVGAVQMNASGIREVAITELGEERYFREQGGELNRVVETELERNRGTDDEGRVLGIEIVWRDGMEGENGLEGAWQELCNGKVLGSEGLVIRL